MRRKFIQLLDRHAALVLIVATCCIGHAQSGSQGSIAVSVLDATGGIVPGATLELVRQATNDHHIATSSDKGIYTFVNLPIGTYSLEVTKGGYAKLTLDQIAVHAAQTNDVIAALKVGQTNETVTVDASSSSLIETTSNSIENVIDLKYVEDLPLGGRDLSSLVALTPGYQGTPGYSENGLMLGTFNGQVEMDTGSNIDGVIGAPSRGKYYGGNADPIVTARIENIGEMAVQTDMMDVDQGFGQSSMQVNYVSRSGTNQFHGRAFEDFKNDGLYANTWTNDADHLSKQKVIYNDFGVSVGGPILRNKLFFFGTFSMRKIPGSYDLSNPVLTAAAQAGNFGYTYTNGSGATQTNTVNLYNLVAGVNNSLPTTPNSIVTSQLSLINSSESGGNVTAIAGDPNVSTLNFKEANPETLYYPMGRFDYNVSSKLRTGLSWNMTQDDKPNNYPQPFPGSSFSKQNSGYEIRNFTLGALVDWNISPSLINQFRGGFLYNAAKFSYNQAPLWASEPTINWAIANSGQYYSLPVTEYYPLFNGSDTISLQRGNHTMKFGASWYREQDHYWNPPAGFPNYDLGLANGDPALNAFSTSNFPNASAGQIGEAENLYATLVGRISGVYGSYTYSQKTKSYNTGISAYNLDEVSNAWAWYAQDSWRISPSFTLNYGIRWDYTGDNYDKTGAYHSAGAAGVWGPTPVGAIFQPGTLGGPADPNITVNPHAYQSWDRTPEPQVGIAWNPNVDSGPFVKIMGGRQSVVRAGFSLKKFNEPYQFYWDAASDYGSFFYQYFSLNAATSSSTGYFPAGSLALGDTMPAYLLAPTSYMASEPESELAFQNFNMVGMDPHIQQPYVETWNLGIQRELGRTRAIEIRYQGNHSVHQWVSEDPNEVNIFENGFLTEFKRAQANLAAYQAQNPTCGQGGNPPCSFAGQGGQSSNLPIMTQAFQGEASAGPGLGLADFTNAQFLNYLTYGEAGAMASALSGWQGTVPYICNLVGANFTPCQTNLGYTGTGTYPINFFQANPYTSGSGGPYWTYLASELEAEGYANYNSLQVEFRQQNWKGLQLNANYNWSHTLGFDSQEQWTATNNLFTMRPSMKNLNYTPAEYDIRQVIHANGTYDLPFGKGKAWLNGNNALSSILGNWTLGNIVTWQTGMPQLLTGGYQTFNDYADGGVTLSNGVTTHDLQKAVHVHRLPASVVAANWANGTPNYVVMLDSRYLASSTNGGANTTYINPNTTAGVLQPPLFLHGTHGFYHDLSVSKNFPVWEGVKLQFQGEFLNLWNHPVFGNGNGFMNASAQSNSFGLATGGPNNGPRHIQLRANIEF